MQLGKIEKLVIRDQWKNEEYDFTPWLAGEENIQLLGDEINLDFEVMLHEYSVSMEPLM
jgi:hypothetical protein